MICIFVFGLSLSGYSQSNTDAHTINLNIPNVALLGIQEGSGGNTNITMSLQAPATSGGQLTDANSNSDLWLNVTSITGADNKITASISPAVPNGTTLSVVATLPSSGAGNFGDVQPAVPLDGAGGDLIKNIGCCYTSSVAGTGYNLTYNWTISDYNQVSAATYSCTVTYTIVSQ